MPLPLTAEQVLDREFLEIRAKILQLAASFDRLNRGDGDVGQDPRMALIREGLEVLLNEAPERAEQVQLIFSRPYEDDWQQQFQATPR